MGRNKSGGEEERLVPAESGLGPGSGKTDLAPPIGTLPYHSYCTPTPYSILYQRPRGVLVFVFGSGVGG